MVKEELKELKELKENAECFEKIEEQDKSAELTDEQLEQVSGGASGYKEMDTIA